MIAGTVVGLIFSCYCANQELTDGFRVVIELAGPNERVHRVTNRLHLCDESVSILGEEEIREQKPDSAHC
jgi:hypothetical protein